MPEVDEFFDPIKKKWLIEIDIDDHGQEFISKIKLAKNGKEIERQFSNTLADISSVGNAVINLLVDWEAA